MRNQFLATTLVLSLALGLGLTGCKHSKPNTIFMPDMVYSPALKAQQSGVMMPPVPGTVPRDFQAYPYAQSENELAGRELKNPLVRSGSVLARGQVMYNTYCIVCHGASGEGDGSVVPKFPRPPSLQSEKVLKWADGNIYHVISSGQNLMPSYAPQVTPSDRWAIVHYIRVLQRSKNPPAEDLKAFESLKKGS